MLLILTVVSCLTEIGIIVPKQLFPRTAREQLKRTWTRRRHKNRQLIISSRNRQIVRWETGYNHPFKMRWLLRFLSCFLNHPKQLLHTFPLGKTLSAANTICWIYRHKTLGKKGASDGEERVCSIKSSQFWNNSPRPTGKHCLHSPPSCLYLGQSGSVKPSMSISLLS